MDTEGDSTEDQPRPGHLAGADALERHLHEQKARAPDETHGDELQSDLHNSTLPGASDVRSRESDLGIVA